MGGPSQRLGAIPGREGVGGKTRVDEGEVRLVVGIDQVMIVLVDLDRGQLPLVDNILA